MKKDDRILKEALKELDRKIEKILTSKSNKSAVI